MYAEILKSIQRTLMVAAVVLLVGWNGPAGSPVQSQAAPLTLAAVGQLGNMATRLAVGDSYAYLVVDKVLYVVDTRDPQRPFLATTLQLNGTIWVLRLVDTRLYMLNHTLQHFQIYDVRAPLQPKLLASSPLKYQVYDFEVVDGRAYFRTVGRGPLLIYDVSDPSRLTLLGESTAANVGYGQLVAGNLAYFARNTNTLDIYDISNPQAVTLVSPNQETDPIYLQWMKITVAEGMAYLASAEYGLSVIDVSNPRAPVSLGTVPALAPVYNVAIAGRYAFLASGPHGLVVLSLADRTAPTVAAQLTLPFDPTDVVVHGSRAYLTSSSGIYIVDIADPSVPRMLGSFTLTGRITGLAVDQRYIYASTYSAELAVIDARIPARPAVVTKIKLPGAMYGLSMQRTDSILYVHGVGTETSSMYAIDVSRPLQPVIISATLTPASVLSIAIQGSIAYVLGYTTLTSHEISDPRTFRQLDSEPVSGYRGALVASWPYVYHMRGGGMSIYDSSSPTDLQLAATAQPLAPPTPQRFTGGAAKPPYLYVSGDWNPTVTPVGAFLPRAQRDAVSASPTTVPPTGYLGIFDMSDPGAPTNLARLDLASQAYAVEVVGQRAFVILDDGIAVVDVSSPAQPVLLGVSATGKRFYHIIGQGDLLYTNEQSHGLEIYGLTSAYQAASTFIGATGGTLTSAAGDLLAQFPSGSLAEQTLVEHLPAIEPEQPINAALVRSFRMRAQDSAGLVRAALTTPYTLTLRYTDADLAAAGVAEADLAFYAWNGAGWVNLIGCTGCSFDRSTNTLTVRADRFTDFALASVIGRLPRIPTPTRTAVTTSTPSATATSTATASVTSTATASATSTTTASATSTATASATSTATAIPQNHHINLPAVVGR